MKIGNHTEKKRVSSPKQDPKAQVAVVDTPGVLQSQLMDYMKVAEVIVFR
ncbi:MAG: hypothetical protein J5965_01055 [Aeriscardovia sp.]|nr:hypothetical protein [Aeriscardovia sp.]